MARPSFGPQARHSNGKKKTRQGMIYYQCLKKKTFNF